MRLLQVYYRRVNFFLIKLGGGFEGNGNTSTLYGVVSHREAAAVRTHDMLYYSKSKTGTAKFP